MEIEEPPPQRRCLARDASEHVVRVTTPNRFEDTSSPCLSNIGSMPRSLKRIAFPKVGRFFILQCLRLPPLYTFGWFLPIVLGKRVMTDREKSDHWAELASVIGAEVPPEEPAAASPETSEPAFEQKAAPERPRAVPAKRIVAPSRPAADWGQLAADLGIAPPPPPPPPPPAPPPALPASLPSFSPARSPIYEQPPRASEAFEAIEEELEDFSASVEEPSIAANELDDESADELAGYGADTAVEQPAGDMAEDAAGSGAETPAIERKSGRRRRKRRRRSREPGEARSEAAPGEEPVAQRTDVEFETSEEPEEEREEEEPATASESAESEPSERRPRRRRRRGASRRAEKGPREESARDDRVNAEPPGDEEEDELETDNLHDSDDFEDEDHEEGEEGEEGEGKSARIGFRNIPTWGEAVGIIIATNMESRAKNPGSGRSQGGNRGRGGNRPGRRRPPDKRN